ncbi:hypothetical protein HUO13_31900 [Saccharopolyspora erythraea]|uniref:hypothetical protein n=1 Tax=Saccharopolyspora erythraea TaxID=1836 RepID=UPI001BACDB8E|nr:hypothetical protein [Saccharopolyspora erythraea]QUH04769.1 hypothetical protein HUO13_31900 [Saccharopolyspora erythraea]
MVALPHDVAKVAEYGWLQPGERFHRIFERRPGYLASTVAGRDAVPHEPLNPVPKCVREVQEDYLKPSELLQRGEFAGDEWVHDRGVRGWATASSGDQLAVRAADVLAAGNGYAWLVATTHRTAVVIPARFTDLPPEQLPPPAPLPGLGTSLITWWQCPPDAVRGVRDELLGRTFAGAAFARVDFADGSTLLLRQ